MRRLVQKGEIELAVATLKRLPNMYFSTQRLTSWVKVARPTEVVVPIPRPDPTVPQPGPEVVLHRLAFGVPLDVIGDELDVGAFCYRQWPQLGPALRVAGDWALTVEQGLLRR
jgi:hypothetical protein